MFGLTKTQQTMINELIEDGIDCFVDGAGWHIGDQTFADLDNALTYAETL